ncbi:hypothetical protein GEMRC1_005421 [Eukaryota sp. GEM-RC1]
MDCSRFSSTSKGSGLSLTKNGKRVDVVAGNWNNIRGDQPLLDGNVYSFTVEMSEGTNTAIGVIEEGQFQSEGGIFARGHVYFNHGYASGCLQGYLFKPTLSGFNVVIDLVNYTISIGSNSRNLPRPSAGNYYLVGILYFIGQFIEIH